MLDKDRANYQAMVTTINLLVIACENDRTIVPVKVYQIPVARHPLDSGLTGRLSLAPCLHVELSEGNKSKCSPTVIHVI